VTWLLVAILVLAVGGYMFAFRMFAAIHTHLRATADFPAEAFELEYAPCLLTSRKAVMPQSHSLVLRRQYASSNQEHIVDACSVNAGARPGMRGQDADFESTAKIVKSAGISVPASLNGNTAPMFHSYNYGVKASTVSAAKKVMASQTKWKREPVDASKAEADLESALDSLREAGEIGPGVIRSSKGKSQVQSQVQSLPSVHLSPRLAHAAELASQEQSNGYRMTGGVRPRGVMDKNSLQAIEQLRGHARSDW
jgi:hypothetical protein